MTTSLDERLAVARAATKERTWVTQRIADARADRERIAAQLVVSAELLASEKADVDRLASGVGGFFRRVVTSRGELPREQQELAAARLQHEALTDELEAIDVDLAQLATRAAAVKDADAQYQQALVEVEAKVKQGGSPHTEQLADLAQVDGQLRAARRELAEAVAAGRAAHDALMAVQQALTSSRRASYASDLGSSFASDLGADLVTATAVDLSEHVVHDGLRTQLAAAQRAMATFQRECRDVANDAGIDGVDVTPLPGLAAFVVRDLLWTTAHVIDDVGAEVEMLSSYVATTTMELRGRDRELESGLADVVAQRAAILDPGRERL